MSQLHLIEVNVDPTMDRCIRLLMETLGMYEVAQPGNRLTVADVCEMCTKAKSELEKQRTPNDEGFTVEDGKTAEAFPAEPIMRRMIETYHERRGTYGPSEQRFGEIMVAMFPDGLTLNTKHDWVRYGLFHQIVGKLSRYVKDFANPHVDSVHDIGPYAAMLEAEDRRGLERQPFFFRPSHLMDRLAEEEERA